MNKSELAVVILNYNSWQDTLKEIELCQEVLKIQQQDIIVVDNASPNESAEELEKASGDNFIFIKSLKNVGYAAGNNIGLKYAYEKGYKYAWILNNDIIFKDELLLERLLEVFKQDAAIAVVNPDVYALDGHLYNRDATRPEFWDYTFGILNYRNKGREIEQKDGFAYVYRPQGCCMIVDLEKMNRVDYMDENTFLYVEEPILAERLNREGYKCACCTTASIVHNHSKTIKSCITQREIRKIHNASFAYYLREYRNFSRLEILICCVFHYMKLLLV